ncbi:hypothetical protein [Micromonospora coerulea]|uniref:hypothetical protein n=1 Tax=Micromonospora coerulea TaxID=47856 RepID=UPI00190752B9|nr:hypothetical protein [Micromonospora veneta]
MNNSQALVVGQPCPEAECGIQVENVSREDFTRKGPHGPASDIDGYKLTASPCGHTREYIYT